MKKPRCGTEPAWELFRGDALLYANLIAKVNSVKSI